MVGKEVAKLLSSMERYQPIRKLTFGSIVIFYYTAKAELTDKLPIVIILKASTQFILGLNIHYIPVEYRMKFFGNLSEMGDITIETIGNAWNLSEIPNRMLNNSFKKYSLSSIQSPIKELTMDDIFKLISIDLPEYSGMGESDIIKSVDDYFILNKGN